jgi:hypothetical protein
MKQIDDISEQADHMEKLCLELDDYTKYLGKHTSYHGVYWLKSYIFSIEQKLRNANRTKT